MGNKAICINRRHGVGGGLIAEKVAEKLGVKLYDHNLLQEAIEFGGLDGTKYEELLAKHEEHADNRFTYRLLDIGNANVEKQAPASEIIFDLEKQVITKASAEGDIVVVGRCAGSFLENEGCRNMKVFLTASRDYRINYVVSNSEKKLSAKEAEKLIDKVDHDRAVFFKNFCGCEWDDEATYDVILNVENLGIDETVAVICAIFKDME